MVRIVVLRGDCVHGSYRGCGTCIGPTGVYDVHGSYRGYVTCMGPTGQTPSEMMSL